MLRDEIDTALNDLLVQCESNARHFEYTAELLPEKTPERGRLARLATQRQADAERLRHVVTARGQLPSTADSDWDTLLEFYDRIAARLGEYGVGRLLRERADDENRLAALAHTALALAVPDDLRPWLERLRDDARASAERLRERRGDGR